jgi:hypothetical protein
MLWQRAGAVPTLLCALHADGCRHQMVSVAAAQGKGGWRHVHGKANPVPFTPLDLHPHASCRRRPTHARVRRWLEVPREHSTTGRCHTHPLLARAEPRMVQRRVRAVQCVCRPSTPAPPPSSPPPTLPPATQEREGPCGGVGAGSLVLSLPRPRVQGLGGCVCAALEHAGVGSGQMGS